MDACAAAAQRLMGATMSKGLIFSMTQAMAYLRKQRRKGMISHWEIGTSDTHCGMFGIRVSKPNPVGASKLFDQAVSCTHYGRDMLSAAHRAVAEVNR